MSRVTAVIANQRKLFLRDKGMLFFYLGSIAVFGIVYPLFVKDIVSQLALAAIMTVTLQRQWASESVAGERENRTLESLLSTPLQTRAVVFGKVLFNFSCAVIYYLLIAACILLLRLITAAPNQLSPAGWGIHGGAVLAVLALTAFYGVLRSAKAGNVREAGTRPVIVCYLFVFLLTAVLAVLTDQVELPAGGVIVTLAMFFTAALAVIIASGIALLRLDRPALVEIATRRKSTARSGKAKLSGEVRSQTGSVFAHEMKYLATLKGLILQFSFMALTPALFLFVGYDYFGQNNLYYAVLITIVMIPRIPSNLIAYSVGGEKAYKTGESILATPVSVSSLFWGKAAVPMVVCVTMLVISAALNLVMTNWIGRMQGSTGLLVYSVDQLVLLVGVGLGISTVMILAAAILSLKSRNPRKGLYFSTILGFCFILPALAIVYLTDLKLVWSLVYFAVLVAAAVIMYNKIRRLPRSALMASLR